MFESHIRIAGLRSFASVLGLVVFWACAASAGGNHHGKTVYLPVAGAPVYQVQSAPVYQLQAAPTYQLQAAPTYQVQAAPTYQVQAAPTYQVQAAPNYQVQAAPTYQVQAAPTYQLQMVAAAPPAKAAAAPVAKKQLYEWNGYTLVPVNGSSGVGASPVGAAPGDEGETGRLSTDDFQAAVDALKKLAATFDGGVLSDSELRDALLPRAQDLYAQYSKVNDTDFTDDDKAAVKSLIDVALGKASTPTAAASQSQKQTQTQTITVQGQVIQGQVLAAPMQLFLPVRLKHGHVRPY